VLTGGWQTSKETAYVEATRARHGTDWYIARDELGDEGQDPTRSTGSCRPDYSPGRLVRATAERDTGEGDGTAVASSVVCGGT
jgi:hypothetical protein